MAKRSKKNRNKYMTAVSKSAIYIGLKDATIWTSKQATKNSKVASEWALNASKVGLISTASSIKKGISIPLKFFIKNTEPSIKKAYKKNKYLRHSTSLMNAFTIAAATTIGAQHLPDIDDLNKASKLKQNFSNFITGLTTPSRKLSTNLTDPGQIIRYVMVDLEGGAEPFNEGGGHFSVYGINSKYVFKKHEQENMTKKRINWKKKSLNFVYSLNEKTAYEYYKERYWDRYNVGSLPPEMRLLAFDAYVQHGDDAKSIVRKANKSADKLLRLRRQHYAYLVKNFPEKNEQYESGWNNRLNKVASKYKTNIKTPTRNAPQTLSSASCSNISNASGIQYTVMNSETGEIICQKRGNVRSHPASLTKPMALAVVFDAIDEGVIALNDSVKITKATMRGSNGLARCGKIKEGDRLKVRDLMTAAGTRSDAISIIALARHTISKMDPSTSSNKRELAFVELMNKKANEIGMKNSNFSVITGRTHHNNKSTPNDIALLFKHLNDNHPRFSKTALGQKNASNIGHMCGSTKHTSRLVNGWYGDNYQLNTAKTGLTSAAGFNQAIHFKPTIITVVFGARGNRNTGRRERTEITRKLYEYSQTSQRQALTN